MNKTENQTQRLQFIFTEKDFYLDIQPFGSDEASNPARGRDDWRERFETDKYHALYQMGFEEKPADLAATANFLYIVSDSFLKQLTGLPELELARESVELVPSGETVEALLRAVPFAIGAEYIDTNWIRGIFKQLLGVFSKEISNYNGTVEMYLTEKSQHLHVPERIFFHLVENRDTDFPFAFLATYATRDTEGRVIHVPLKYALTEYKNEREKLLMLLSCLNRAAEVSELIGGFIESGEMFHPLRLTAEEAYTFLKDIEAIENTGILCRIPNWWKKKASSLSLEASLGDDKPSMLGFDTLISVQPRLTVDGMELSEADIRQLLEQTEGLALLKGKWVEVDHAKLRELLQKMEEFPEKVTLLDAMQLELGQESGKLEEGITVSNGEWLSEFLMHLRKPETIRKAAVPKSFHATLRPYQKNGYTWLNYMDKLGFGACLADDMGLGKTVQVLAYLEKMRTADKAARVLLVLPASLMGNWQKEAEKFAPDMKISVLHGKRRK